MTRNAFIALGFAALTVFGSSTALADAKFTTPATPTSVFAGYTDGAIYIGGLQNVEGCSFSTMKITRDPQTVMSLALAAMLSGHKLSCYVDTDPNKCVAGYQIGYQCVMTP